MVRRKSAVRFRILCSKDLTEYPVVHPCRKDTIYVDKCDQGNQALVYLLQPTLVRRNQSRRLAKDKKISEDEERKATTKRRS
jgi:hypothetical protein